MKCNSEKIFNILIIMYNMLNDQQYNMEKYEYV